MEAAEEVLLVETEVIEVATAAAAVENPALWALPPQPRNKNE